MQAVTHCYINPTAPPSPNLTHQFWTQLASSCRNDASNMENLNVETFLGHVAQFGNKESLTPAEASLLLLKIAELVLDNAVDVPLLKFLSRFLTQQSYDELVEERNIEHQCGYPLCGKLPKHQVRRPSYSNGGMETATRYQIWNRKPSMILPNTYLLQYCCKEHYQASLFYRNQLSQEAVFARKNILMVPPFAPMAGQWYENNITCLEEVLAKHRELKQQGKSLGDVIAMMNGLSVTEKDNEEVLDLVKLIQDFDIIEHEGGLHGEADDESPLEYDADTASKGVDGYITTNRSFGGYVV